HRAEERRLDHERQLADHVFVVMTAQYLVFVARDPLFLAALARLPYPLLPTLVVPAIVLSRVAPLRPGPHHHPRIGLGAMRTAPPTGLAAAAPARAARV